MLAGHRSHTVNTTRTCSPPCMLLLLQGFMCIRELIYWIMGCLEATQLHLVQYSITLDLALTQQIQYALNVSSTLASM